MIFTVIELETLSRMIFPFYFANDIRAYTTLSGRRMALKESRKRHGHVHQDILYYSVIHLFLVIESKYTNVLCIMSIECVPVNIALASPGKEPNPFLFLGKMGRAELHKNAM